MKKLLLAVAIIATIIVSSCSSESLEDGRNEKLINTKKISPSERINAIAQDTILPQPDTDEPIDDGNPPRP